MAFPKLKNKHLGKPITKLYTQHENFPKDVPKKVIIIYDKNLMKKLKNKYKPKKKKDWNHDTYELYYYKGIGIAKMKGIGSPHAVSGFEDLVARGGKEFINLSFGGGLNAEGTYIITKALRDEGTSYHYDEHRTYSFPDKKLTEKVKRQLEKNSVNFEESPIWTTDAQLMETKEEIEKYSKKGIKCVDMETSALFTVAKKRNVKICSIVIVSDILGKKHEMKLTKDKWDLANDIFKMSADLMSK